MEVVAMKRKRASRAQGAAASKRSGPAPEPPRSQLEYKVVELSTVDEAAIESTLNEWAGRGWNYDGMQFAMRESSKRPAMAFVLFTREGTGAQRQDQTGPEAEAARRRLQRMAEDEPPVAKVHPLTPRERLIQLAEDDDPSEEL
jgi:hypothetical protein